MKSNDEKIKELMESEKIPRELEPENIKDMLDEHVSEKKRSNIKRTAGRIAAAAAACAVVVGGGAAVNKSGLLKLQNGGDIVSSSENKLSSSYTDPDVTPHENKVSSPQGAFMHGAESYQQIYDMLQEAKKKQDEKSIKTRDSYGLKSESGIAEDESATGGDSLGMNGGMGGGDASYSTTFNQEDGVLESDIYQTDGRYIYHLTDDAKLMIAEAENGIFLNSNSIDISDVAYKDPNESEEASVYSETYSNSVFGTNMYLYNDKLIILGSAYNVLTKDFFAEGDTEAEETIEKMPTDYTFVAVYSTGLEPELISVYYQEGYYSDVRISPEGYMYLITNYWSYYESENTESEKTIEEMLPWCGVSGFDCIDAGDILLPDDGFESPYNLSFTVIGSIDLNGEEIIDLADIKALAGYSGIIYCSPENLYTSYGWDGCEITRFSISGGEITPAASCEVEGYVKDQFSMSEYNDTFRVATTKNNFRVFTDDVTEDSAPERNNHLYVFDMDLNEIGDITDFGIDESIQSVSFSGDMAYVVTFRQTDPLFAIDLSDPAAPVITDELKINGFSSYMQKWDDGKLFGFGIDADDEGIQTGVKAVMFDNSDPYDLKEIGKWTIEKKNKDDYNYSRGIYERKALLIAPEKNIIGFPVDCTWNNVRKGVVITKDDPLTVREWASEDASKIGTVDKGATVTITYDAGDWYCIDYNDEYGYVSKKYVQIENETADDRNGNYRYYTTENKYIFLSYEDGKFNLLYEITVAEDEKFDYYYAPDRALYIGDYLYVLSQYKFTALDMSDMSETDTVVF